jgi:hypothetical protein
MYLHKLNAISFLLLSVAVFSQQRTSILKEDSILVRQWNLVPILAFDSDNGFRFGSTVAIFRLNRYSVGSYYRPYTDNLFLRGYYSTKHNFQSIFLLETNSLIKKSNCFIELSASKDHSFHFYGINGYQSNYQVNFINPNHADYISQKFYVHEKSWYKIRFDHQHYLSSSKIRLLNGLTLNRTLVDFDSNQLIHRYSDANILRTHKNGLVTVQYATGLIVDHRTNQFYCKKGIWHEAFLVYTTDLNGIHFIKSILTLRHYIPVYNAKNVFMSRISFQNKLAGEIPYDLLGVYYDSRLNSDGIGGASTLRGKPRNRLIANGFILNNLEIRHLFYERNLPKTNLKLEGSLFFDHYFMTQRIQAEANKKLLLNENTNLRYVATTGIGAYLIFNESGVISFNYALPLFPKEQGARLYIGAGFMF